MRYTFKAYERLKGKKRIATLFQEGHIINDFSPLQLIYLPVEDEAMTYHQVLFSVPKKRCKHAADRNRLKRKMREAYRLNKHRLLLPFANKATGHFLLAYVYTASDIHLSFVTIQNQILASIAYLNQVIIDGSDNLVS